MDIYVKVTAEDPSSLVTPLHSLLASPQWNIVNGCKNIDRSQARVQVIQALRIRSLDICWTYSTIWVVCFKYMWRGRSFISVLMSVLLIINLQATTFKLNSSHLSIPCLSHFQITENWFDSVLDLTSHGSCQILSPVKILFCYALN